MKALSHAKAAIALWAVAVLLVPGLAFAQAGGTMTTITRGHVWTQTGGTFSVGTLSDGGGTFTTTVPPGTVTARTVGPFASGTAAGAATEPALKTTTRLPMAAGRAVEVAVENRVTKAAAALAIGRAVARVAGPIGVGMAFYDAAQVVGMVLKKDPATDALVVEGQPSVKTQDYSTCSNAGGICFFETADPNVGNFKTEGLSITDVCNQYASKVNAAFHGEIVSGGQPAGTGWDNNYHSPTYGNGVGYWTGKQCRVLNSSGVEATQWKSNMMVITGAQGPGYTCSNGGTYVGTNGGTCLSAQKTLTDLQNAIASQSGWPGESQAALAEAIKAGEKVAVSAPTVSGPASVPGPTSTATEQKVDPATGKKGTATTTTSTTYNNNYNNNTVNVTQVDNSSTVWNFDDGTTRTDTGTETKEPETDSAGQVQDPSMPEQPKLYERKYPDGMTGVWDAKKAELQNTPLGQLKDSLMPSVASSGSCPVWMLPLNLGLVAWNYGEVNVAPPCWVWDFGKAVIIISALLLARALIFGG